MVIAILLILLVISVAIVGALYSSFLAFYATFGDTLEYNKAYYVATAGLERAELVLKYRMPGYEGSGGWERDATSNKDITY
jgi:type II secretory pathway component PulK